jgi:hypothetical protein
MMMVLTDRMSAASRFESLASGAARCLSPFWISHALRLAFVVTSAIVFVFCTPVARANPYDTPGTVLYVRPYSSGTNSFVVIQLSHGGSVCGTDTYTILLSDPGGQGMLAAALEALALEKSVTPEISNATGCTGWGTVLQSLMITS